MSIRSRTASAAVAIVASVAALLAVGTASATAAPSTAAKPTVVLVHGAWADASSWSQEITALKRAGYPVLAPPNPLRSLLGDAKNLRLFLSTVQGPIILVGHSYGGAVITNAATGNANVKALVYIDAFALNKGDTVFGSTGADSVLTGDPATLFDFRPYAHAPTGAVDIYLKPSVITDDFAPDVSAREQAVITATQRPISSVAGNQASGPPAWRTIPSWFLVGTDDKMITPAAQLAMAERAHSHVTEIASSHVSLISHPTDVDAMIVAAANATSSTT